MKSPGAAEQLRLGVLSYHRGRYAEAILLFEKALAYAPGDDLIEYWLGRSYLKSGYEETALRLWQPLLAAPDAPPFLKAKAEALRGSRAISPSETIYHFVEVERFEGRKGKERFFNRPSTIIPRPDGSLLVVAHGSNELVMLDASGVARQRSRGGLAGFDRPYGAAYLPDGTLFVTEFNGDRISRIAPDGSSKIIGKKGRTADGLIGPQYAATDAEGYLFVVDFGNARVSKFDDQGNFILSFGDRSPDSGFPGFVSPAGIFVSDGTVYVADSIAKSIYKFDDSGNYLGALAEGELHFPESLSAWEGGRSLLVADTDRIVSVNIQTEAVSELYRATSKKARIVGAATDYNGNLVACDFDASVISVLSDVSSLASGYGVEIQSVDSSAFPKVTLDVIVRKKDGSPVVGLREGNFYLTETVRKTTQADEGGKAVIRTEETIEPTSETTYLGSGDRSEGSRSVLVLERSAEMSALRESQRATLTELYAKLSGGNASGPSLVTAGSTPELQPSGDIMAALRIALTPASGHGRFELALRLAATSLLPSGNRDAIVYLGTGAIDEAAFSETSLGELAALMRNNDIRFFAVVLGEPDASLRYLAERTGGNIFSSSRPRGLGDLAAEISSAATGRYRFSFTSKAETSFGRGYLAVSVEAYLYKKSGKDELGYYAPLK
ncbi:MAG: tetratricopeptide repeat protein [Rectinemataceae bacterium]|jgi:sugar lactone lactonase YvrE